MNNTLGTTSGMHSLAIFYHSIPDYCEINHLPENEFDSIIQNLKMAYLQLKLKPNVTDFLKSETSQTAKQSKIKELESKWTKKRTTHKKNVCKKDNRNPKASDTYYNYKCSDIKSDVSIEKEVKRADTPILYKSRSMHQLFRGNDKNTERSSEATSSSDDEKKYVNKHRLSTLQNKNDLRKSFSFNNLYTNLYKDKAITKPSQFSEDSNQVQPKVNSQTLNPTKIIQNKEESSKTSNSIKEINKFRKTKITLTKVPFSILGLNKCIANGKSSSISPIHPVARSNLAATLRIENARKKVKEIKNDWIFNDHKLQYDWEVRKTPAWKFLNHNESHEDILAFRLATRRAEQDFQKQQYNIQMETMRQRVKSAPLLLEGPTYWEQVGKLSHSCNKDNLKCNSKHEINRKKKKTNKGRKCSNKLYSRNSNYSAKLQDTDELSSLDRAYL